MDVSAGMLEKGRGALPAATFIIADAADLPFETGRFDAVTCVAGIPYLDDVDLAFDEWHRVTRSGGRLVATVPSDDGLTSFALLRDAARKAGIELAEPNAGLGSQAALGAIGREHGFVLDTAFESRFDQPLTGNAGDAFEHVLAQGLAEPLRDAIKRTRDEVLATYRVAFTAAARAGQGSHCIQFVKWRRR